MWISKAKLRAHIAKKSAAGKDVLDKLNAFLDAGSAEPVYWLQSMWGNQQKAITYKEIRQAITNGYMSTETLTAWQKDYAAFVNNTMNPLWTSSMEAANTALSAKYPEFFFNPMMSSTQQWVTDHGAEWVTSMTSEQKNAIAAILKPGTTGQYTVDELSRLIRPCIGLNADQSAANLNYYNSVKEGLLKANPNMKPVTAAKMAQEAALKFAEKQHTARAHTIATTEMAFAYNVGAEQGVKQAQEQGFMGTVQRVWRTADDETVCGICAALDGVTIDMEQEFNYKGQTLYAGQKQTPPAHPRCRCAVEYEETEPPVFEGTEVQPDQLNTQTQIPIEPPEEMDMQAAPPTLQGAPIDLTPTEAVAPTVPTDISANGLGITLGPKAHLGGTGTMYTATDKDGNQWLFKPAQSKSGTAEPFRAEVQVAGYKVQNIVDPDTAVKVGTGTIDGKFGAFQRRIDNVDGAVDLKAWQTTTDQLPDGIAPQLQREHVTDWLVGNYDSHGGNFILDTNGRLVGVDKEQALRYIAQPASKTMSYSYHPNATYGETEPIYNTMYRRFAKGEIDLNLQDSLTYIKRVEAIPNSEYREIFRGYAESLNGKGKAAEELLDEIVERKTTLRESYRSFYSDLLTERTGKKQAFTFADEIAAQAQQPIAATLHTPEALKKMSKADLLQLAKGKKIAYYNNMDMQQLVSAISDPSQAAAMSQQVKDRLAANAAARRAAQQATPAPQKPGKPKDIYGAEDVFKDMSYIPSNQYGTPVFSDRDSLEGLNFAARRITIDGVDTYELSGKLTFSKWQSTSGIASKMGQKGQLLFEVSDSTQLQFFSSTAANSRIPMNGIVVRDGSTVFEILDGGELGTNGMLGFFRIRTPITGNGQADAGRISTLMDVLGLDDLFLNPTAQAELIYKKSRLLWRLAPSRTRELRGLTGQKLADKIDDILKSEKIDPNLTERMKLKRVFDGYSTYVDVDYVDDLKKAGLEYVWSGVGNADNVVQIVKTGGLTSTNTRMRMGVKPNGASPEEDIRTGGSDNVFTRVAVRGNNSFSNCPFSGRYQIMISADETARTDWYAYEYDNYGRSNPGAMEKRKTPVDFVASMVSDYKSSNEVMFRHGIPTDSFFGIACGNNSDRTSLISKLRAEGITKINGQRIEDFIKVQTKM